jgi:hypothetical protein
VRRSSERIRKCLEVPARGSLILAASVGAGVTLQSNWPFTWALKNRPTGLCEGSVGFTALRGSLGLLLAALLLAALARLLRLLTGLLAAALLLSRILLAGGLLVLLAGLLIALVLLGILVCAGHFKYLKATPCS